MNQFPHRLKKAIIIVLYPQGCYTEVVLGCINTLCCHHTGYQETGGGGQSRGVRRAQQKPDQAIACSMWVGGGLKERKQSENNKPPAPALTTGPLILPGSHVLPPQPAALVPPPLCALLPVHENQLSALPLSREGLSDPRNREKNGQGAQGVSGAAHLPETRRSQHKTASRARLLQAAQPLRKGRPCRPPGCPELSFFLWGANPQPPEHTPPEDNSHPAGFSSSCARQFT